MEKLSFIDFLWLAVFEIFQIWTKWARLQQISLFKTFASNWPSFLTITKLLKKKKIEKFCEGLKWIDQIPLKIFIVELVQENLYQFCLVSFSVREFCAFLLSYNGNNLPVMLLNSQCRDILLY